MIFLSVDLLKNIPFSTRGSYIVISLDERKSLWIRHISGGDNDWGNLIKIEWDTVNSNIFFNFFELRINKNDSFISFTFYDDNTLVIKSINHPVTLKFATKGYDNLIERDKNIYEFNCSHKNNVILLIEVLVGETKIYTKWNGLGCEFAELYIYPLNGISLIKITDKIDKASINIKPNYEEALEKNKKKYDSFSSKFKGNKTFEYELAQYILWSNIVSPRGLLKYETIYSSKNKMTNAWSWDNLFTILPLINKFFDLSINAIKTFTELQREDGLIPDFVNDVYCCYNFCKPPIIGFIIEYLNRNKLLSYEEIIDLYEPLKNWALWWLNFRDDDKDYLIQYNHGNESGMDNSTIFISSPPIESPDLNSYLIILFRVLQKMAILKSKRFEMDLFRDIESRLYLSLINLWDGEDFVAYDKNHNKINSESLQKYIPLILEDLKPEIINQIHKTLIKKYLSPYGITTEAQNSKYFNETGYWRGPIWAPTTFIFYEALQKHGYLKTSQELRKKYLAMIKNSYFSENYNPKTGEGLCDTDFSWTASIFLTFYEEEERVND